MSINKAIWISYDLGLKGDYSGLYTFLDSVKAKECGVSFAFFEKDYGNDLLGGLKNDIEKLCEPIKNRQNLRNLS